MLNILLDPFNLILIGIALVFIIRLSGVLGNRTGKEPTHHDNSRFEDYQTPKTEEKSGKVIPLPKKSKTHPYQNENKEKNIKPVWQGFAEENSKLAKNLQEIAEKDPDFNPKQFIDGAKMAYEIILQAFSEEDLKTLKNMLSNDVYKGFEEAINNRKKQNLKLETRFIGFKNVKITEAWMARKIANITIRFSAQLISATKDQNNQIIEGDEKNIQTNADIWTFMRNITSNDPNWTLVETNAG